MKQALKTYLPLGEGAERSEAEGGRKHMRL